MKTLATVILLSAFVYAQGGASSSNYGSGSGVTITTVSGLNSISGKTKGTIAGVTDGNSATDCTTGSGTTAVTCQYSGSVWASVGGGGVTTTGSPATLQFARMSGASSITSASTATLDAAGNAVFGNSMGTFTPPACTAGSAGGTCLGEGTALTNVANTIASYADSTQHELMVATNGASSFGMLVRRQPGAIHLTAQTASKATSTLCDTVAGACNVAGMYHVHFDFIETGTACASVTAGSVSFNLTWTDTNGTAHSAVIIPMLNQTGATSVAQGNTFTFATALANAGASGDFNVSTNGNIIQYATTYVACTTGTGTYQLDAAVTRIQ